MTVGFCLRCLPDGTATCHISTLPDSARSGLVSWARDDHQDLAVALVGRLYYLDELRQVDPGLAPGEELGAAQALSVYSRAGLTGLQRLEGEFALVVWDGRRRRLFAHRDPFGSYPLFWVASPSLVAVGTNLEKLVSLLPQRSFDLRYIADFLMRPSPVSEVGGERTIYVGAQRVPTGTSLEIRFSGEVHRYRYWDWSSQVRPSAGVTLEQAGEEFASLLRRAVRERVRRGPTAAHLSGGMDSSAVVALAREEVINGTGPGPLSTLTLVYECPSLAGERAYAELMVARGGPIRGHFLGADAALAYQWFDHPIPPHDEPYGGLVSLAIDELLVKEADALGAATILTGFGCDELLETEPFQIADLLRCGRWPAHNEAVRWARAWNLGYWTVWGRYGLEPLFPVLFREGLRAAWSGWGRWPSLGRFTVPPWVRAPFAREHGMLRIGRGYARKHYGPPATTSALSCRLSRPSLETLLTGISRRLGASMCRILSETLA